MSKQKYCELIDELCSVCEISNPQSMYETCDLLVMDVAFTLLYREPIDGIVLFCEYGEVPEANRAQILERVLEANTLTFDFNTPCFTVNPETKHVLVRAHVPLENLTAQELLTVLGTHAMSANVWRKTHFLDDVIGDETSAPPSGLIALEHAGAN